MRITVIGTGYLGAVHAACMAEIGHDVLGVDSDVSKITALREGRAPFFEPELEDILLRAVGSGKLRFGTSLAEAGQFGEVHFICVGTPQLPAASGADLSHIEAVIDGLAPHLTRDCLVAGKSTVPVGTAARLAARIAELAPAGRRAELAWNPEFLREGYAVQDTLRPDRIVVGSTSEAADATLRAVYAPGPGHRHALHPDRSGHRGTGEGGGQRVPGHQDLLHQRGGQRVRRGRGGRDDAGRRARVRHPDRAALPDRRGSASAAAACPRTSARSWPGPTNWAWLTRCSSSARWTRSTWPSAGWPLSVARELAGGSFTGRNVAVLGAAFKPDTDDVRDSPALSVAAAIQAEGAVVRVHDPRASYNARKACPTLDYAEEAVKACEAADVVLHLTEWREYREIDPVRLRSVVRAPRLLDGRNVLPLGEWRAAGWTARTLGSARRA